MSRELLARAVALRVIADRVKELQDETKASLHLETGDRLTATLNGVPIGSVSQTKGRVTASVTDERAFAEWVEERNPDEIRKVVSDFYRKAILDVAKKNGAPVTEDGEVIPGVSVNESDGYVSVRPNESAADVVARAWLDGSFVLPISNEITE